MSRVTAPRRRRAVSAVDEAFAAEMAELARKHHEAWLAREPGDGLVLVEVLDPETHQVVGYDRVKPRWSAFPSDQPAHYLGSNFTRRTAAR